MKVSQASLPATYRSQYLTYFHFSFARMDGQYDHRSRPEDHSDERKFWPFIVFQVFPKCLCVCVYVYVCVCVFIVTEIKMNSNKKKNSFFAGYLATVKGYSEGLLEVFLEQDPCTHGTNFVVSAL